MPVFTSTQHKKILEHVLENVISNTKKGQKFHPIALFLEKEGIDDIEDLLSYEDSDIRDGSYHDENGMELDLLKSHALRLINFRTWIQYLQQEIRPGFMDFDCYMSLNASDWQVFCVQIGPGLGLIGNAKSSIKPSFNPPSVPSSQVQSAPPKNSVSNFYKSIKRDKMAYTKLTKPEYMETWHRTFVATCKTHDCTDILDPTFRPDPNDSEEIKLFEAKQEFMFSVFDYCLQTDITKDLVRAHELTCDAQSIYKELEAYRKTSTAADLKAQEQMEYFTTARFDERWSQGAVAFIIHWHNQVRLYNNMKSNSPLDDAFKLSCLQRAVRGVKDLRNVSTTANTLAIQNGTLVNFEMYYQLLITAATILDSEQEEKQNVRRRRSINRMDRFALKSNESDGEEDDEEGDEIEEKSSYLDLSPDQFMKLNQHAFKRSPNNDRRKVFDRKGKSLPPSSENAHISRMPYEIWSKIPPEIQAMLQEHNKKVRGFDSTKSKRNVQFHHLNDTNGEEEIDFEGNTYDLDLFPDTGEDGEPSPSYSVLEHVSGKKLLSPGDIRKVLAVNKSKTFQAKPKQKKVIEEDEPPPESITINGRTYVAKLHKITYKLDKHKHSTTCSLIDRGANGGLAGADVRILERSLRTVDVTGIDNHQVNDLSIVTCAGKVSSNQGPLILIMHQYAYFGQGKTIHSCCQLEHYQNNICDKSRKAKGGKQRMVTLEGHVIPFQIRGGLPYMEMSVPNDEDMKSLPHVIITSDMDWDPSILDNEYHVDEIHSEDQDVFEDPSPYVDNTFTEDGRLVKSLNILNTLWNQNS